MVPRLVDLSAKDPVRVGGIGQDDGDQHGRAGEEEDLARMRRGSFPDGDAAGHDIREDADFYSDNRRFTTIVENLISNAIKHHSDAGSGRFIRISGTSGKDTLELAVADNGTGIANENIEKIFDMFYRISANTPGSGIGLYILKETVEKLQGSVKVSSQYGI